MLHNDSYGGCINSISSIGRYCESKESQPCQTIVSTLQSGESSWSIEESRATFATFTRSNMMLSSVIFSFCFIPILGSLCQENSPIYHFRIGDIRGTVLYDGPLTFSTNPFFVPFESLRSTYEACFRPIDPLTLSQNILLLESKVGRVLVDPGSRGGQANPLLASGGLLFENMRGAGILPESIDHVFLTHAHADHVSGLLGLDGGRAFRNAKVYIGVKEHRFWTKEPLPISDDHPLRDTLRKSYMPP